MPREPGDPSAVDAYLRRRATRRRVLLAGLTLLLGTAVLGNAWQHYRGGDDRTRFDRHFFVVRSVMSGDRLALDPADAGGEALTVQLLGVDAPDVAEPGQPSPHWAADAYRGLREQTQGRRVLLALPALAARSPDGTLPAYAFLDGDDAESATSLNERLVADGHAYADRRTSHAMRMRFEQVEDEARGKRRGLWKDVRDDQQPAWRQAWLMRLREEGPRPGLGQ